MTQVAIWGAAGEPAFSVASTTNYLPVCGSAGGSVNTTEANAQQKFRGAGTFENLRVRVRTNGRAAASTVTVRQNGGNSAITLSITGSTTGTFSDLTHSFAPADGDTVDLAVTMGTGAGTITFSSLMLDLLATSQSFNQMTSFGGGWVMNNSATTYFPSMSGNATGVPVTTEAQAQNKAPVAGTLSNLQVFVSVNSKTAATAFKSRVNTANGAQNLSVTSSTTGLFEDSSNTDTLALGDLISVSALTGASSAALTVPMVGMKFAPTTAGAVASFAQGNATLFAATAEFGLIMGALDVAYSSTESDNQVLQPSASTVAASRMTVLVSSNASAATATMISRVATANGSQTLTFASATTGFFQDSTNSDATIAAAALVGTKFSGTTTGSVVIRGIGMLLIGAVAGGTAYNQACAATTSPIAALVRQDNKPLAATTASVASLARSASKPLTGQTSPVADLSRSTGKPLAGATSPVATASAQKVRPVQAAATTSPVASRILSVGIVRSGSSASVAAVARAGAKTLAANTASLAALARSTGKPAGATTSPTASLSRSTGKPLGATTAAIAATTAIKVALVSLAATTAPVAALARRVGKGLAGSSVSVSALVRQTAKTLAAAGTQTAAMLWSAGKIAGATTAPVASLKRADAKTLGATTSPVAAMTASRVALLTLAALTSPVAALARSSTRTLSASTSPVATLARSALRILAASANVTAALRRAMAKTLAGQTSPAANAIRSTAKPLAAATQPIAGLTRRAARFLAATTAAIAGLVTSFQPRKAARAVLFFMRTLRA